MLQIVISNKHEKGLKWAKKRGLGLDEFLAIVDILQRQETSPARYRDHVFTMDRAGLGDYRIRPDWVLIYEAREAELMLFLVETGSYSDLRT